MENSVILAILVTASYTLVVVNGEHYLNDYTDNEEGYQKRRHKCDIYTGSWVHDGSYPLYDAGECPFIQDQFGCEDNGRPDRNYLKFSWKPSNCALPRFDGVDFLNRLRGKRILFVGDSISLNQWQSLVCMLHTATPNSMYSITRKGGTSDFVFPDYNASLMLMRDGFLIKVEKDEKIGRILDLNSVSNGNAWRNIDILIFNTWHWWLHTGRKQPWDYIREGNKLYEDMDRLVAYEKGLRTWAKWIDSNLDTRRTKVYFQAISPDHMDALNWRAPNAKTCVGVTQPEPQLGKIKGGEAHGGERVLERVIGEMKRPVHLLKITELSKFRRDGHPGIYGIGRRRIPDCSHWCLPGIPDTWNHLLYVSLVNTNSF